MVRSISVSPEPSKELEMQGHKGMPEPAFSHASPSSQTPIVIQEQSGVLFGGDNSGEDGTAAGPGEEQDGTAAGPGED